MAKREVVKVEGFRELEENLKQLPKATARNVVRRALQKASEPFVSAAKASAPRARGQLAESIKFSSRLSARQSRLARKERGTVARMTSQGWRSASASGRIEIYAGASALPHAHMVEYGTVKMAPRPFMRPAWDSNKYGALDILKKELGNEIMKAAKRMEAKVRRLARKS